MMPLALLFPVFVQVAMTFVLLACTGRVRIRAVKAGEVAIADIALGQSAWPARATQFANAYKNQFELPVLFYVLVVLILVTGGPTLFEILLSWVFVATRIVHAFIHVTHNRVSQRFRAFVAGVAVLGAMWVSFAIRAALSGVG